MNTDYSFYTDGWDYISAIFYYFENLVKNRNPKSHIAPKFIYRGISRRYYTESRVLENLMKDFCEGKLPDENDERIDANLREEIKGKKQFCKEAENTYLKVTKSNPVKSTYGSTKK